ncbi:MULTISPECIES: HAD-IA family hydrolase [unclassified Tolypothrix]|uniref:HAD-IA family hydrolase n=1 Tax=unclassified Tolypothrix TaxID=2649714 RepID=UPI0005EAA63F|nr:MULTISPECIES: HAD-IA family hydrolase [unclassified Tolypothrix]BAY89859.1 HAD-superfamily hydrolase subfamily IA, variant 3 [Microchaete diplosiphon NIES-3275]EKF00860.1 HAD-superfamily hydrolase, subfamily IA, variant 3 [Tolypothrix sp. PCC 7601]MBE9087796.1 HAD-IA family hydrolase [Tolypothrix sp. LEGE 11397]UYD24105.1 HAD-IA family hydrolase [Tolypothrix sp. PCC 7712]UYD33665.1 HAD-IA family hydrolase [Tolypothrix sp. PCC 7601]
MKHLCIIFDLDGTLVDSEKLCNQAFIDLLPFIDESIDSLIYRYRGRKLALILADIEIRYGVKLPIDFEATYRQRVNELFEFNLQPIPGVSEMLKTLEYPFCIASSAPIAKIRKALNVTKLLHYFDERLFSSYEIGSWKPDPGLFLYAANKMGFPPEYCVVIEDSDVGIQAAHSAGIYALKYSSEEAEDKNHIFSNMKSLAKLLDNIYALKCDRL